MCSGRVPDLSGGNWKSSATDVYVSIRSGAKIFISITIVNISFVVRIFNSFKTATASTKQLNACQIRN